MRSSRVDKILATLIEGNDEPGTLPEGLCFACLEALPVSGVGMALITAEGHGGAIARTDAAARSMEDLQGRLGEGRVCVRIHRAGLPICPRVATPVAHPGYRRDEPFCVDRSGLSDDDIHCGQALADVATIGLLQERAVRQKELLAEQLQTALNSRILVEPANGVLAERAGVDVDDAFRRMRAYSRSMHRPLTSVASAVTEGAHDTEELHRAGRGRHPGSA